MMTLFSRALVNLQSALTPDSVSNPDFQLTADEVLDQLTLRADVS